MKLLKDLRTSRLETQAETAKAVGTSASTLSQWETGQAAGLRPSFRYQKRLASHFGVDPHELWPVVPPTPTGRASGEEQAT